VAVETPDQHLAGVNERSHGVVVERTVFSMRSAVTALYIDNLCGMREDDRTRERASQPIRDRLVIDSGEA
jgi:hypothetical protein